MTPFSVVPGRYAVAALIALGFVVACGSKGGSSSGASPNCAALSVCCAAPGFPATEGPTCTSSIQANNDATCQGTLSALKSLGFCQANASSSSTTSGTGGAGGGGGSASSNGGSASSSSNGSTSSSSSGSTSGGPIIQSLTANPTAVTPTMTTTISAIVSDTSGIGTLTGGTLLDKTTGTTYGAFGTPGGQGTFVYTLTWTALYTASAITFAPGANAQRVVTARFFDAMGRTATQDLTLTLQCDATTTSPCSSSCEDLANDVANCGTCGNACSGSAVCKAEVMGCSCVAGLCAAVVDSTNVAGASCALMCKSLGATCATNTCPLVPSGGDGPNYQTSTCADATWAQHVCCCQQ
jgi:hypothetical protein